MSVIGHLTPRVTEPSVAVVMRGGVEVDSDIAEGGVDGCVSLLASLTVRHGVTLWQLPGGGFGPAAVAHHPDVARIMREHRAKVEIVHEVRR